MVDIITRAQKNAPLSWDEQDGNLLALAAAIEDVAERLVAGVGIASVEQDPGGGVVFVLSDGSRLDPVVLPAAPFSVRDEWASGTAYARGDIFPASGRSYLVTTPHVSSTIADDEAAGRIRLLASGGIPDAPDDGRAYVRQGGEWVLAPEGSGSGSGGAATTIAAKGVYEPGTSVLAGEVWEHGEGLWLARRDILASETNKEPVSAETIGDEWHALTLPGRHFQRPVDNLIYVASPSGGPADALGAVLYDFEQRLAALEA